MLFMSKDPAFLFYPSDFLTGTIFMSNEQVGIYIRLLSSQHQHGGIIGKIAFNSMVGNNEIIRDKFIETETGFYNERLTCEMDKRNKKSNNMSETAKDVWKKRKDAKIQLYNESKEIKYNSNTNVKENDTIVIQPVNRNENVNIDSSTTNEMQFLKISECRQIYESRYQQQQEYVCKDLKISMDKLKYFQDEFDLHIKKTDTHRILSDYVRHFANWTARLSPEQKQTILQKSITIKKEKSIEETYGGTTYKR